MSEAKVEYGRWSASPPVSCEVSSLLIQLNQNICACPHHCSPLYIIEFVMCYHHGHSSPFIHVASTRIWAPNFTPWKVQFPCRQMQTPALSPCHPWPSETEYCSSSPCLPSEQPASCIMTQMSGRCFLTRTLIGQFKLLNLCLPTHLTHFKFPLKQAIIYQAPPIQSFIIQHRGAWVRG